VSTTTATVSTTAAAVESAATTTSVEAATTAHASTVEAAAYVATAVERTSATCEGVSTTRIAGSAMVKGSASPRVANSAPVTDSAATVAVARSSVVATAAIVSAATVVSAATPIPVVPGAGSDEETTDKPARPVVAVGRACVRIIVVIPPRADRGGVPVAVITVSTAIANPDTYTYLGTRRSRHERCRNYQRAEQHEISENLHFGPPRQGIMHCVTNRFGDTSRTLVNFGCLLH
jgi:hypothetical protein